MVNYDIAVAGHAFSAGYIDVSCIFVFIYLFSRGIYVGCFSKPSVSNIQTQPINTQSAGVYLRTSTFKFKSVCQTNVTDFTFSAKYFGIWLGVECFAPFFFFFR